jgi:(p)ppGpp synthase/HD superfamily hydrolase
MWKEMLRAARFARWAHAGQKRAHGGPYYRHPMAVARSLWKGGHREPALLAAAYLHDVLEDTPVGPAALEAAFGPEVLRLVSVVTKAKGEELEAYYRRVKAAGAAAMALKVADRGHNNSELKFAPPEMVTLREKAKRKTAMMLKVFSE